MKVIIAGSRCFSDIAVVADACRLAQAEGFKFTEIVSGTCRGVDKLGEALAAKHNIPVKQFPAQWNTHGRSAGYKRNEVMAVYADALIAVWDGKSRGTKHMIDLAHKHGLRVFVYTPTIPTQKPGKDYIGL